MKKLLILLTLFSLQAIAQEISEQTDIINFLPQEIKQAIANELITKNLEESIKDLQAYLDANKFFLDIYKDKKFMKQFLLKYINKYPENGTEQIKNLFKKAYRSQNFKLANLLLLVNTPKNRIITIDDLRPNINVDQNFKSSIKNNNIKQLKILLKLGANPNVKTEKNSTIFIDALENNNHKVAQLLINFSVNIGSNLLLAAENGYIEIIKQLLNLKIVNNNIVNYQDKKYGETPLIEAATNGHFKIVKLLLKYGAMVNLQNNKGETALMLAAYNGHLDIVELLLKSGVTVNLKNKLGDTALMLAVSNNKVKIAQILINNGADVNIQNNYKDTALLIAVADESNVEMVKLLLSHNVDISLRDIDNKTALDYAILNNSQKIVDLIQNSNNK